MVLLIQVKNLKHFLGDENLEEVNGEYQGGTICGLSSLASFLKILSSKRVCCVFRDIRDKNAVNEGFWSKTAVFSLPATKILNPQSSVLSPQLKNPH